MQAETEKDRLDRIESKLDDLQTNLNVILSAIIIRQKDACLATGVHPDTVKRKSLKGDIDVLVGEDVRTNYLQLKEVPKLKIRSKRR